MGAAPDKCALDEELCVRNAQSVVERISNQLSGQPSLTIEAEGLASVDSAGLQVLVSAHLSAAAAGKSLVIRVGTGTPLRAALARAGLLDPLDARAVLDGDDWVGLVPAVQGEAA